MTDTRDDVRDDVCDDPLTDASRAGTPLSQRRYDPADGDLTTAIVGAVADAKGVELAAVTEPLLYESIDADALEDSLFDTAKSSGCPDHGKVAFEYDGFDVVVDSDGWITVYEQSAD